jgi:hypothetical protein
MILVTKFPKNPRGTIGETVLFGLRDLVGE